MDLELEDVDVNNKNIENLEITQNIDALTKEEQSFFETNFGKIINSGIDIGIKAIFPSFMENEIVDIKNVIITEGFKNGLKESVNSCTDIGKSFKGIITGEFENFDQLDMAIKKGGILDFISDSIDTSLKIAVDSNLLNKNVSKIIKSSKNILLDSVSSKIGEGMKEQIKYVDKLKEHTNKWQKAYEEKDLDKMKKSYTFVKKYSEKVMPIEDLINKANEIENIQNLIEKNGENFEIEDVKLELAKIL